jgi:hypothetical protein
MRVARLVATGVVLAALVPAAYGAAATPGGAARPKLTLPAVKELALRVTQPVPLGQSYQPDPRVTVEQIRLVHSRRGRLLWIVHVHGTVPIFPCRLSPPGTGAPSCVAQAGVQPSDDILVTILDANSGIINEVPADASGTPLSA